MLFQVKDTGYTMGGMRVYKTINTGQSWNYTNFSPVFQTMNPDLLISGYQYRLCIGI